MRRHPFPGSRTNLLSCLLVITFTLAQCGGGGGGGPAGPGDDDTTGVTVLETKKQKVEPTGGDIVFSDGTTVAFPAGAVGSAVTVTANRVDPSSWFDTEPDRGRAVISCEAAVQTFGEPVEIRVPLPDGMTEADSSYVFAGLIDEESGAVTMEHCTVRTIGDTTYAVLPVTHFSSRLVEWLFGKTPPPAAGPLEIPYYNQGSSQYCWATSVQMVTQASRFDDDSEIPDIIGRMGIDEGGITSFAFRMNSTLAAIVRERTGKNPVRTSWDFVNYNNMKDYLKSAIGVTGSPVAFFCGPWSHAVVLVGYDGDTFYIDDPASTSTSSIGYKTMTWKEIVKNMSMSYNLVALYLPSGGMGSGLPPVTVNIMPDALEFLRPSGAGTSRSYIYRYGWDYRNESGYSFRESSSGDPVDTIPGQVITFSQKGDIEIINPSRSTSVDVSVWYDITGIGAPTGTARYSYNKRLTVPANATGKATLPAPLDVDEFRYNGTEPRKYLFSVTVLVGGTTVEEQSLFFTLDTLPVTITSLSPSSGPAGTKVTVSGSGFGTLPKNKTVTVNGVAAEADTSKWTDTSIVITIPGDATTGPVKVKNGEVESNGATFTVTTAQSLTGTMTRLIDWYNLEMEIDADWRITGEDLTESYQSGYDSMWFTAKAKAPVRVEVTPTWEHTFKTYTYNWSDGEHYSITTFSDLELVPLPPDAGENDPDDLVRIGGGHFPLSLSMSGDTHVVELTFNNDVYYESVQFMVSFTYKSHEETYLLTESGPVLTDTKDREHWFWALDYNIGINHDTR